MDVAASDSNSTKRFLAGDWYCPECHTHNFAKRSNCFRCKSTRPESEDEETLIAGGAQSNSAHHQYKFDLPRGARLQRGDWGCSNKECRAVNFSSRTECFCCGEKRPQQPNEWACPQCDFCNLDFRRQCMKCSTPNPNPNAKQLRDGDWNCSKCEHYNFSRRSSCQQCGESK